MEGFHHMGKIQSHGWFSRYENPKFFIEFLFKRKRLNSQNKFEREPTEKKFQKIKHHSLKKKILAKEKKVFFKRKDFLEQFFLNGLFSKTTKFLIKTKLKFWSVTTPTPLGKISSPRFQLILK